MGDQLVYIKLILSVCLPSAVYCQCASYSVYACLCVLLRASVVWIVKSVGSVKSAALKASPSLFVAQQELQIWWEEDV